MLIFAISYQTAVKISSLFANDFPRNGFWFGNQVIVTWTKVRKIGKVFYNFPIKMPVSAEWL
jgi:hypothetical protein